MFRRRTYTPILFLLFFLILRRLRDRSEKIYPPKPQVNQDSFHSQAKSLPPAVNTIVFATLLYPKRVCHMSSAEQSPVASDLIILIKTTHNQFRQRQAIRSTWGNNTIYYNCGLRARILFILGLLPKSSATSSRLQDRLFQEKLVFDDIVQFNFTDVYVNNTLKVMASLEYIAHQCPQVRFISIIDDDFLVHPTNLVKTLLKVRSDQYYKYIAGEVRPGDTPLRDKASKCYISYEDYPFKYLPPFIAGGTVILSLPVARVLVVGLRYFRHLSTDDVLIAIILRKLNVPPINLPDVYIRRRLRKTDHKTMISSHGFRGTRALLEGWKLISRHVNCVT
ncbi:unnamed protein product [Calicophoron daubneyi]|uniref:Hexosyltransferase n=1 Tax=Calicophoron daubneyi TaxID=300641 RepID=A0AAV2SXS3_CALDB